ncbi:hypothetical protein ZOSMA_96G00390, partial [Zostera marina]
NITSKGTQPFDFARTSTSSGHCRNPQTELLLEFLELPYLLDGSMNTGLMGDDSSSLKHKDKAKQVVDDNYIYKTEEIFLPDDDDESSDDEKNESEEIAGRDKANN